MLIKIIISWGIVQVMGKRVREKTPPKSRKKARLPRTPEKKPHATIRNKLLFLLTKKPLPKNPDVKRKIKSIRVRCNDSC